MIAYSQFPSPLGELTATSENGCITALWLPGQKRKIPPLAVCKETPELRVLGAWLKRYFQGENPAITFPLAPEGTDFQRRVWALLRNIPYGESVTYGSLAKQLGSTMSSQAVGQAVGKNPIAIVIPCHRVLGAGGRLTGYAGGLQQKATLLDLEKISHR